LTPWVRGPNSRQTPSSSREAISIDIRNGVSVG